MSCVFKNDNNIKLKLVNDKKSATFSTRDNHEVIFRRINTFLINENIIPRDKNIIDLGAWIGDNSLPWAENINGIVYAIDPSPSNIKYIEDMCELNKINNVKCIKTAISDKNESLSTRDNIDHCSFVYDNNKSGQLVTQKAVSLDFLYENKIIENVGYIHLDVEGMEYRVLCGCTNLIDTHKPIITFEQHLEIDNYDQVLNFLVNRGYKVYMIDEVLPGCRKDCRNSIAFHESIFESYIVDNINTYIGRNILVKE